MIAMEKRGPAGSREPWPAVFFLKVERCPVTRKQRASAGCAEVKTVSTFPPEGTFTKDAETIARIMATKKVSPKGIGSAIRMIQYFINRAGKSLPAERKAELEQAKKILQKKVHIEDDGARP